MLSTLDDGRKDLSPAITWCTEEGRELCLHWQNKWIDENERGKGPLSAVLCHPVSDGTWACLLALPATYEASRILGQSIISTAIC